MVIAQRYNVITPEGHLDRNIFGSEQIYQEELEKIFSRAWLFIGHESLIQNPNDFFLAYMGEDPVILTRDPKGKLHVFLNMCMHRGNRIVRADKGNAKSFMCAYHGWTFSNEGKLVSVPGFQEAYYGELPIDKLGLVEARAESYAGLVFATWDPEAPGLEAYLGDMRWYLDIRYNHRDVGVQAIGPVKWLIPANWKMPVENASGDNYHAILSHRSAAIVQERYKGQKQIPHEERYKQPGRQTYVANGHGLQALIKPADNVGDIAVAGTRIRFDRKYLQEWSAKTLPEVEKRLGAYRARRVQPGNFGVWPNFYLGMRICHPRSPIVTENWSFETYDKDAPEEVKAFTREQAVHGAGLLSGLAMQDDMDNWRGVTDSGRLVAARLSKRPHDLTMGINHESPKREERPGIAVSDAFCSETNQRYYYQRWQEFMNAGSWKDIHTDPITAKFEGTATFHG